MTHEGRGSPLAWGVAIFVLVHLAVSVPILVGHLNPILENPGRSYDEKIQMKWGPDYTVVSFILKNTPENATILMEHALYGAPEQYFLFPRKLLYGGEETLRTHPEITYIVIDHDFPNFYVNGEKILMDDQRGLIKVRR